MKTSETLTKIAPALVKALSEIEGAAKSASNSHFRSKYATLENVIDASRDVLKKHGLCLMQFPSHSDNGSLGLETVFMHESGEWVSGDVFQIAVGKQDPQGFGSALTYARRYAQVAAMNIPTVDDDGEAAMGRAPSPSPQQPAKPKQTLSERADAFAASMKGATTKAALDRVWGLGEGLRKELDKSDPERAVELSELYTRCADAMAQQKDAA